LAVYYYEGQKYASSALIGQDLLARQPKSPQVLDVVAQSYEGLNLLDRALQHYESLYLVTNAVPTLYKMAILQYQLKKYPESLTNIDILLANPEVDTLKLVFPDAQKKEKEYAMRVAILNLKGMVYKDQADKINAKKYFDEALKIAPDFAFAKENSESLK
jgi:tetratricopeptide (TPR) repeat protein